MKRLWILLLIVFFVPVLSYGQVTAVFDATLNGLIAGTWVEQAAYFAENLYKSATQIDNLVKQVEYIKSV